MKHIVIEIGTNSIKALSAELGESGWDILSDKVYPTRIGAGLQVTQKISEDALKRNLDTVGLIISQFPDKADTHFHLIATESLRMAENAEVFMKQVKNLYGISAEIISGDKEGELAYRGATYPITNNEESVVVSDIGGGSTEFTLGLGDDIRYIISLPIGAVKLTELCIKHDPATKNELNDLNKFIDTQMAGLHKNKNVTRFIGVGGTVTTLALLSLNKPVSEVNQIEGKQFTLEEVLRQTDYLAGLTIAEKNKLLNMPAGRADIIVAGSMILSKAMINYGQTEFTVSTKGVRHGYLFSLINP